MSLLDIRIFPDPVLKQPAAEVTDVDATVRRLLTDMVDTMYAANGVGLAAPQVGISRRIAVVDVSEEGNKPMHFVNPEIIAREGETSSEEGCLSIPDYRDTISRNSKVTVRAIDINGNPFELHADGLLAICLQHEIDHLDGILFVDRLSRLKREMFKKWFQKRLARE